MKKLCLTQLTSALVLTASSVLYAQDAGETAGGEASGNWFTQQIPDALAKGDLIVDMRARYEFADLDGLRDSNAYTLRTRLGYETAPIHGFSALMEFEDVRILGDDDGANFPGSDGKAGRTIIADPEATELNRAWLGYKGYDTQVKLGRQRIKLDNDRFIGNVGWRQNEQTYDALSIKNQSLPDTTLFYAYLDEVNRIFGDESDLLGGQRDFESNSHVLNAKYAGLPWFAVTGYAYLLDLENPGGDPSSDTFGLSLSGAQKFAEDKFTLSYYGEYAYQQDGGDNPVDYDANYYHLNLGGAYDRFNAGIGYESLGSDGGAMGFSTPLATLHAFNGWADVFLGTPGDGLEDLYLWAGVKLPYDIPLKVVYHNFEAEDGGADFGYEIDVVASKSFGKHWSVLTKYAHYNGDDPRYPDLNKFWAQVEFKF